MHRMYEEKLKEMEKKTITVNGEIWEKVPSIMTMQGQYLEDENGIRYTPQKKDLTLEQIRKDAMGMIHHTLPVPSRNADKLSAIRDMIIVADYVNEGWTPDWSNGKERKYYIYTNGYGNTAVDIYYMIIKSICYFKSEEAAERAIKILGIKRIETASS